jgi:phosphoglycolate phosphatase-like HAD superfamily hydrolase
MMGWTRLLAALTLMLFAMPVAARGADPLPSWHDTGPKQAIMAYVGKVTAKGPGYVAPAERIAVFDNDGALWPENPVPFQAAYAFDEIRRRAPAEPALAADPMVQALLAGDMTTLLAGKHHDGLMHIMALTHAGMTTDEFNAAVSAWMNTARHPKFGRPYDQLTYQPMQELLRYLRANGFKTFIVSGGGADFMRVWSERVYGIPPEQVVGSSTRSRFEMRDGRPVLVKTMDAVFVDDKDGKPVGIQQFIGRRPIAAFGNSDGDKAMLEYVTIGNPHPSFGMIVRHTDAAREYQYDVNPKSSGTLVDALKEAPARGWTVVDMAADWRTVFADTAPGKKADVRVTERQ